VLLKEMNKYEQWTVVKLREELARRKARVSGRKNELVERYVPCGGCLAHCSRWSWCT